MNENFAHLSVSWKTTIKFARCTVKSFDLFRPATLSLADWVLRKLRPKTVLVFETKFTVKFDQKLGGKDRTEDNLTD